MSRYLRKLAMVFGAPHLSMQRNEEDRCGLGTFFGHSPDHRDTKQVLSVYGPRIRAFSLPAPSMSMSLRWRLRPPVANLTFLTLQVSAPQSSAIIYGQTTFFLLYARYHRR